MSPVLTIFKLSNNDDADAEVKIKEEHAKLLRRAEESKQRNPLKEEWRLRAEEVCMEQAWCDEERKDKERKE